MWIIVLLIFVYLLGMFYMTGEAYAYAKENNKKLDKILKLLKDNGMELDETDIDNTSSADGKNNSSMDNNSPNEMK